MASRVQEEFEANAFGTREGVLAEGLIPRLGDASIARLKTATPPITTGAQLLGAFLLHGGTADDAQGFVDFLRGLEVTKQNADVIAEALQGKWRKMRNY